MKVNSKDIGIRLALAGVGSALGVIFVALSYYLSIMTVSFTVLTAVGIICPLSKNYYREGILTALVIGIIGFFIANIKIVPYAMVSGLYVVLTVFLYNKKVNLILLTVLKLGYACLVFWIVYKLTGLLFVDYTKIKFLSSFNEVGIYVLLNAIFAVCFLLYDWLLIKGYEYSKILIKRVIKR